MLFIQLDRFEFCALLQNAGILLCGNHALMLLAVLLGDQGLDVDLFVLYLKSIQLMGVIDRLVGERILEHSAGGHLYEEMPCHIVSQVSHDDGSPPGFLH